MACAYLGLRLRATRRVISDLIEATQLRKPVLIEQRGGLMTRYQLDRLIFAYNRLITENASISDTGRDYFDQIQTTLGNLREAVVMVDRVNAIRLANPAFTKLAKVAGNPLGRRLDLFIQGEAFHEFLKEIRGEGEGKREVLEVQIHSDTRWLEVSAAPMQDNRRPEEFYTLFVFHDITRQMRLEKMRTEFVANVSHELRTPVTVIKGFAETLIDDENVLTEAERTRFLEKIRTNSERLHNLLQDLLLLSRLESTDSLLNAEAVSLSAFLGEMAESWKPVLAENGQELELDCEDGDDTVEADPLRLSQLLTNLLENIVRHARGFTRIRLITRLEDDGVRMTVEDDGPGIPEKDLPYIFQRFYRVDKGRSRESGGTGLGLSIVKHIAAQHNAEVHARIPKVGGTAIDVLFPYPDNGGNGE